MKDDGESHNKPYSGEMDIYQQQLNSDLYLMQNGARNADLNGDDGMQNRYSSLENGEVRDEDEFDDYGGPSNGGGGGGEFDKRDIKVK